LHFYKVIGILMALAALACALSSAFARESSSQKMGLFGCALFLAGAMCCVALARGWWS
jgi:low temperature requirement protein LtrA